MDWVNLNADVNMILNKHYTEGRSGYKVNKIVVHYNAGNLSIAGCYSVWQTRAASAHYQVEESGRIGQLVWDSDTAWHASNWAANCSSIGIEHANYSDGTISEKCLDNGAHLVAALCKYFGLGRPEWLKNVFPHKYFAATSCPGQIYGSQKDAYIKRAQQWYDSMTGSGSAPSGGSSSSGSSSSGSSSSGKKTVAQIAKEVIAGSWGNGDTRRKKLEAAGYDYDAVQVEVNRQLGASGSSSGSSSNKKSVSQVAKEVIAGSWGNGDTRKKKLEAAGYNYSEVQAEVNKQLGVSSGSSSSSSVNIDKLAQDVIAGKYGTGEARKKALGRNYNAVQKRVNEILAGSGSSSSSKKSVDTIAREVIQGKWGNGNTRKKKLEAAGYDYNAVQKRVNQLM